MNALGAVVRAICGAIIGGLVLMVVLEIVLAMTTDSQHAWAFMDLVIGGGVIGAILGAIYGIWGKLPKRVGSFLSGSFQRKS